MEMGISEDGCEILKENGNGAIPSKEKVKEKAYVEKNSGCSEWSPVNQNKDIWREQPAVEDLRYKVRAASIEA